MMSPIWYAYNAHIKLDFYPAKGLSTSLTFPKYVTGYISDPLGRFYGGRMVTKHDARLAIDRVKIEQSAFVRLEGRVLRYFLTVNFGSLADIICGCSWYAGWGVNAHIN